MVEINKLAPNFNIKAFYNNEIKNISLSDFKGKWVVLFFYPADFTFICPTELGELADSYQKLKEMNTEVISLSTDTAFVHKAWFDNSPTIQKIRFFMGADPTGQVCRDYGTYIDDEGLSWRGSFIIDPDGILKAYELHENSIGRDINELIRKIQAAQYVREHKGEVAPCQWKPGDKTLKPGLDLVGKI
ncbi:redoxin domain-containing protein [Candidatus Woesearchaeota archaeon]|jgi:NADH-dependent peroxiredoxin subunit C|nr:redoxin domain-containing protein [Candidatus Woesearchaeota archaeon]MBT4387836.1 redoxin domain-containing protein [Candidatus Woesearchaeota archaeon]MBT4595655.1 redoxin domain-containing protein [Candidatus Woesearchaeota archaeon]MBT5740862.1 redoxin domain-containing protein [Candidatus Woesearchaeota archaeon]MBT6505611.1 redoxin domain-containing protein [Candidatus Woesearchaeota archaeon]